MTAQTICITDSFADGAGIFADGTGSLFVNGGGPDYAGTIAVAPDVDPMQGGAVENLRDGTGNPSGYAAYADRLLALGAALQTVTAFDPDAQLSASATVLDFATESTGWVERLRQTVATQASAEAAILTQIPAGRMGEAGEIASAVLYLASPEAAYVTGSTLHVNGGMAMF